MPFIHSVYCASVFTSSNGSACAEKVAFGVQYVLQTSHPLPVSHASKNASATVVIDVVIGVMMISCWKKRISQIACALRPKRVSLMPHLRRLSQHHADYIEANVLKRNLRMAGILARSPNDRLLLLGIHGAFRRAELL